MAAEEPARIAAYVNALVAALNAAPHVRLALPAGATTVFGAPVQDGEEVFLHRIRETTTGRLHGLLAPGDLAGAVSPRLYTANELQRVIAANRPESQFKITHERLNLIDESGFDPEQPAPSVAGGFLVRADIVRAQPGGGAPLALIAPSEPLRDAEKRAVRWVSQYAHQVLMLNLQVR